VQSVGRPATRDIRGSAQAQAAFPLALSRRAAPGSARGMRSCPLRAAFIRAAKLNPYRRHHRQAAPLPPPSRAGSRAGGRGHRRSRSTGVQATSDPGRPSWRASPHPRCQSESPTAPIVAKSASLPPPPTRAGQRACGWTGPPGGRSCSTGMQATCAYGHKSFFARCIHPEQEKAEPKSWRQFWK